MCGYNKETWVNRQTWPDARRQHRSFLTYGRSRPVSFMIIIQPHGIRHYRSDDSSFFLSLWSRNRPRQRFHDNYSFSLSARDLWAYASSHCFWHQLLTYYRYPRAVFNTSYILLYYSRTRHHDACHTDLRCCVQIIVDDSTTQSPRLTNIINTTFHRGRFLSELFSLYIIAIVITHIKQTSRHCYHSIYYILSMCLSSRLTVLRMIGCQRGCIVIHNFR